MPQINWDEDDSGGGYVLPPAGKYLFAVEKAELHAGANGPYFSVMLRGVDRGKIVVWDNMSFAPKAIAITKAKLSVLGAAPGCGSSTASTTTCPSLRSTSP
jgi:hypothetical protein